MRRSEHSFLTPSLLEIVEPDEEDEFEGDRHSRGNGRPLIEENDCDRRSHPQILKGSEKNITHSPLPIDSRQPGEEIDEMAAHEGP